MPVTYLIIAITAIVSVIAFSNRLLYQRLLFSPYLIHSNGNQSYRFLTYALVHADWMHLLVNMFVLLSFGRAVEYYYSALFPGKAEYFYILLYVGSIAISALPSFGKHKSDAYYAAVGASGAVSAVVFASILIQPLSPIRFVFIPFDIPAFIFGALYLGYSAYMAKKGTDNIGHDAHFWGAVFGIVFTAALKPALIMAFFQTIRSFIAN